mmetsp:Transcript_10836/g.34523  ORF Transcript_10836/g.34523 Transcript_10836/m.34523 type:complete len:147 (-) Transcript_10836:75-515(-)
MERKRRPVRESAGKVDKDIHELPTKRRRRAKKGPSSPFLAIPGVGASLSADLVDLGYSKVEQLADASAEDMYTNLCKLRGEHIDRCVLYVWRCACYFARTPPGDRAPTLLKWHKWSDANLKRIAQDPCAYQLGKKDMEAITSVCYA